MSQDNTSRAAGGGILCPGLFLLFLGLQLTGYINWPWYAVAAPLLIPIGIAVLISLVMLVAYLLADKKKVRRH